MTERKAITSLQQLEKWVKSLNFDSGLHSLLLKGVKGLSETEAALVIRSLTKSTDRTSEPKGGQHEKTFVPRLSILRNGRAEDPRLVMVVSHLLVKRRVMQLRLKRQGYQVLLAKGSVEALRILEGARSDIPRPDIVLVDIEMPRMDGLTLVRNMRADANLKRLPIIMTTSRSSKSYRRVAKGTGADEFLVKPIPEDELLARLRRVLA